mmetsp:Transcript_5795/g.8891  ORF Transcript_5795/g.8891 Transcript_5795/m.8891 type:complete len:140 (-) Transcript_5795:4526-4945(-)
MDSAGAFALATRLGAAFFREAHRAARVGISSGFQTVDRVHLAGQVWLGVCRTQDIIKDFADKNYQNHAMISGEYICFVVESSQSKSPGFNSQLESVVEDVKAAAKDAKEAKTAATRIRKAPSQIWIQDSPGLLRILRAG